MSLLARLERVHDAVQSFRPPTTLPVIDTAPPDNNDPIPGLRFLRDEVKRDCDFLRQNANASTNAPYLVAVWDELVHARQPVAIYRMFSPADKTRAVKVDVVAEHGARWVRVNTIKNTRLVMEFCEIDSYLTSDDDESRPRLAQTEFDNSVLKMGRALLAAAKANPILIPSPSSSLPTTMIPQVSLRLTRLDPLQDDTPDPRIEKTIQCLCDMGVDVQLGQRPFISVSLSKTSPTRKRLEPMPNINLDLSALIALISGISHSPLLRTEQEAHARFEPPQSYLDWKRERVKALARQNRRTYRSLDDTHDSDGDEEEGAWENSHQHSRALAAQSIQEIHKATLQEIRGRTSAVCTRVTFWTTREARQRCLQIVAKIGGVRERQRADALLSSTLCTRTPPVPAPAVGRAIGREDDDAGGNISPETAYWEHSRYPPDFLPLVPVHVYPSVLPAAEDVPRESRTSFFDALARTCAGILSHEAVSVSESPALSSMPTTEDVLGEILPAAQTSLSKLTVHTVTSMLAGAARGHTTLTTNQSSVKAVLKEMRRPHGRAGWDEPEAMDEVDKATLWILDPRSLSECMRSDDAYSLRRHKLRGGAMRR